MSLKPGSSVEAQISSPGMRCVISEEPLDIQTIIESVGDDGAGATVTFIGTTRNSFKGKVVTRLEYQAYSKLAIKTMADIVHNAQKAATRSNHDPISQDTSSLLRAAVYHRIGTVPVGQASIVIAVSAPHRKEAFTACEFILEEVKGKAQIWKREYYEGEDEREAEWKANTA